MSLATDETRCLTVTHTFYKVVGWVCVIFAVCCGVMAWRAGGRGLSLFFLLFVALGVYIILNSGSTQMDSQSIKYYLPLGKYQIKWDEVQYIEIDKQGGNMVAVGKNKRLAMNGPTSWSGKDKMEMRKLIGAQIEKYGIQVRQTEKAMFRSSRNTRVGG